MNYRLEDRSRYKRQRFDEDEFPRKYDRRHRHDDDTRLSPARKERIVRSVVSVPSVTSQTSRNAQVIKQEIGLDEMKRELCDD
jgi:hypothetical protein